MLFRSTTDYDGGGMSSPWCRLCLSLMKLMRKLRCCRRCTHRKRTQTTTENCQNEPRKQKEENKFFCQTGPGAGLVRLGVRSRRVVVRTWGRFRPAGGPAQLELENPRILGRKVTRKTSISWEIGKIKARERKQGWMGS